MAKKLEPAINKVSDNLTLISYKKKKFSLEKGGIGVYSGGTCLRLYQVTDGNRSFVNVIGWTKDDNYGSYKTSSSLINGITDEKTIMKTTIEHIKFLLD